ncbi:G-D-S-L family lipolytic protein [Dokdonia sinensis]|uniref:G-D-S-L family lipolytic protein n=1 Tax=Dokdonia sinensis TaxID=2479847 RepID=A0A3M0G7Z5_9FLAO|nr:G-D-S-L family lipolytic protein [Dokdonia sinensis]RMB57159.1 G-D-S-L family lipolytic protein [Dokdonia sinensis]
MKKYIKYLPVLAIAFAACEPEFDNPIEEDNFFTSGEADFSNYVALGNSLTAGFADGALYRTAQNDSYPNIMAQQFALAGGGEFTQPLTNDNLGGLTLGGNQITANRFVLATDANGNPGPAVLAGTPTTDISNVLSGPFNNMGVPGAKSFHLVTPGYGNVANFPAAANPYFIRIASEPNATVLADAVAQNPSFFSLWIGNNDVLSYATSGGAGTDQTGNLDPSTYGGNDITDPNVFASVYSQQVAALVGTGAKGALVNIADVTSIPFFTTVPAQSIPLDAPTAAFLNSNFALYNQQVLPGLVQFGIITAEEAAARQINFAEGVNFPTMSDDDLTDISQILQGPPFGLDAATAATLGTLRQANDSDLFPLTAAGVLGTLVNDNPQLINGVSVPLADQFVLTAVEQGRVATAQASYNATIQGLAAANDLAYVDARAQLQQVAGSGVVFDGGTLTSTFVTGGAFSLDGVHPSPRGYALTANSIIDAINAKYGATVPKVNIGDYSTVNITNNVN